MSWSASSALVVLETSAAGSLPSVVSVERDAVQKKGRRHAEPTNFAAEFDFAPKSLVGRVSEALPHCPSSSSLV
jgi:hypothetical protein